MLRIEGWKRVLIWAVVLGGLLLALPNGFYDRVERSNDAEARIAAGFETQENFDEAGLWPGWMPSSLVNLGLDLRGGAHLLAEVRLEEVYETRLEGFWPELRDALRPERDTVGTIRLLPAAGNELRVRISRPEGIARAMEIARGLATPLQTLTGALQSDIDVASDGDILIVRLSEAEQRATDERTMAQSLEIIRRRIDEAGTREPTIQRQGERRILIQVPGIGSAEEVKELIGRPALLTFQPVVGPASGADANPGPGNEVLPAVEPEGFYYILERRPVVTGETLVNAQPSFDQNGNPSVDFRFNTTGARAFGEYTSANVGLPFAIVLDGEVVSAPTIQSPITGGSGQITGAFTIEESTQLAILLRAGSLPAGLDFLEERTVGPELGQDSIDAGTSACLVAFVAVLINVALIFGLLSTLGATLTLPGIAGIVLTIGMAVDANVLIFERIREELKTAKGPARAIELGYEKALSAIIDANITTFITAAILYLMGSGPVRGFAITLGLGIITSVFTAIFVTRFLVCMWCERRRPKVIEV